MLQRKSLILFQQQEASRAVVGIVAAVIGGGGIGVAILASAKALAQRYGKAAAAAW